MKGVQIAVSDETLARKLAAELDCVFLNGNRKPGDPVPVGLYSSGTRARTRDEIEQDRRCTAQREREKWNAQVDAKKRAKGKR